jgi:glycosyltransferase involved in cell wall biosynthesis
MLGYVHLPCSREYMGCAFSQKNYKLAEMLLSLGHEVYYYGSEKSSVPCTEFIQTHSLSDIANTWGDGDNRFDIGYDWKNTQFRHDFNTARTPLTNKFYAKCIEEINKRKKDDDFLLVMQGKYHKPIYDAVKLRLTIEPGIGYRGSDVKNYRAFESSYLQAFSAGSENPFQSINGSYFDRVIPNYFDPKDFEFSDTFDDYYLYIGRIIQRKGVWVAIRTCQELGKKLLLVGQKDKEIDVNKLPSNCEFLGFADIEKRKKLMSRAIATFVPTSYLEAFGGTHVESMLSGTPPICTNFGVFSGTIPDYLNGKVGFRADTLDDFVNCAKKAEKFTKKDRLFVRKYGERFLMDTVKWEFQKWFDDLYMLYESTLDGNIKGWSRIREEEPDWRENLYWNTLTKQK